MRRVPRRLGSWIAVVAVAAAAVVLRAIVFSGTELYTDEAYYWLWAQRLAPGYFDHPPGIAWLIRAGTLLARGELGVRVLSLACGGLTIVFTALLAGELSQDPRAPLWGALVALSAPLLHVIGALALPDGPLVAAYTAALWLLASATGPRWVAVGVAVGLALLSKYTAALLAPALLLLVLVDRDLRADLRTRWPWIGAAVALLVFAPCLLWNWRHDRVSVAFQLRHGFGRNATRESFVEFVLGQLAGAGPVAFVLGIWFLVRPRSPAAWRTAAGVLVPLAVTIFSATRGKVEANWPALVYPGLCAGAAALLLDAAGRVRVILGVAVGLSLALLVAFGLAQHQTRLLVGTPIVERFHGWREMAREVRRVTARACEDLGCDPRQPFLVPVNYQYGAALAFYGGFRRIGAAPERRSQLDVWGARPRPGEPFFLIGFEGMSDSYRETLRPYGERATRRLPVWDHGHVLRTVTVTPYAPAAPASRAR